MVRLGAVPFSPILAVRTTDLSSPVLLPAGLSKPLLTTQRLTAQQLIAATADSATADSATADNAANSSAKSANLTTSDDNGIRQLGTPFPLQLQPQGLKIGPFYLTSISDSAFYAVESSPGSGYSDPGRELNYSQSRLQQTIKSGCPRVSGQRTAFDFAVAPVLQPDIWPLLSVIN